MESDVAEMRACIALCTDCADGCGLAARILSLLAQSDHVVAHRLLQACIRQCALRVESARAHAVHHRHSAIYAKACRACEAACRALLDAEALEELETLGGA